MRRSARNLAAPTAAALAAGALLARLAPDVRGLPLFEDEAVAGLVGARPVLELLTTAMWDRGGAPLHFLLAHATLAAHPSGAALRWLSVAFALATVLVSYELGRSLAGRSAGAVAAIVAASSGLLAVYGSFGRMYSLFAFAGGLAALTFLRAVRDPTPRAVALAAAAAWLLPAVHPYGGVVVAVEAAVALALWRGRPLRAALPALPFALAALPFAAADVRLALRFSVGDGGDALADGAETWTNLALALQGAAGGAGPSLAVLGGLAAAGLLVTWRREPAFAALAVGGFGVLALAPVALSLDGGAAAFLSPRHLIFALPACAAFAGAGAARALAAAPPAAAPAVVAALALVAFASPQVVPDPRTDPFWAATGAPAAVEPAAAWVRERARPGDVAFPYSVVFLEALAGEPRVLPLPRAQPGPLRAALARSREPGGGVLVSVPVPREELDARVLEARLAGHDHAVRGAWLVVRAPGPFASDDAVLAAIERVEGAARAAAGPGAGLGEYLAVNRSTLCRALARPCAVDPEAARSSSR